MGSSLYIHWPWCKTKCPYCDFNSHETGGPDQQRWLGALSRALAQQAESPRALFRGPVETVFFGGGTPSLMAPASVGALLHQADRLWGMDARAEITLEANPGDLDPVRLADYRAAGVNRLSIGVQSFDDRALSFLGRRHDGETARRVAAQARKLFDNLSLDLIYALPGQSAAQWEREMDQALALMPDHLSVYQLTIEKGTQFFRDRVPSADEDLGEVLYDLTATRLAAAGYPAYEISNHARPGWECRHNLSIWRGGDYLGIGPGAHGRLTGEGVTHATYQWADPARWLRAVEEAGDGDRRRDPLSPRERIEELIMLGLRLRQGIEVQPFVALTGVDPRKVVDEQALAHLVSEGLLRADRNRLCCTDRGQKLLNGILAALLATR